MGGTRTDKETRGKDQETFRGAKGLGEGQVKRQAGKEDTLAEETRTASDSRTRAGLFPSDFGRMREAGEALAQVSS